MKNIKNKIPVLLALATALVVMTSFEKSSSVNPQSSEFASGLAGNNNTVQVPITIFASGPFDPVTSTSAGTVEVSGAFSATGTYLMDIEFLGNSLHCNLAITLPAGTITIRMNCNMGTFNGVWQIIEGTGAYQNLKGNGLLVMPNDTDEILTGTVRGL